jgi:hypothetical protein
MIAQPTPPAKTNRKMCRTTRALPLAISGRRFAAKVGMNKYQN